MGAAGVWDGPPQATNLMSQLQVYNLLHEKKNVSWGLNRGFVFHYIRKLNSEDKLMEFDFLNSVPLTNIHFLCPLSFDFIGSFHQNITE